MADARMPSRTTTITWSIRARGRRSAPSRRSSLAVGLILWMHHIVAYAPLIFGVGAIGIAYTMIGWWRDVIYEAEVEHDHTRVVQISHRYGMILFIASEVMFFVAWFWAYFNTALFPDEMQRRRAHRRRPAACGRRKGIETFDPWHLPLLNTLILLTSGTTVTWAHHALLENDRKGLIWGLVCTIVLGLTFTCVQAYEYAHAAFHYSGNIYGATFFMATGFHGAHVIIGTIFLIVCLLRALAGQFKPTQHLGFEFAAWYWHFVDVVWLFLFACIYVWGAGVTPDSAALHAASGRTLQSGTLGLRRLSARRARARKSRAACRLVSRATRRHERTDRSTRFPDPILPGSPARCPRCGKGKLFQGFLDAAAAMRGLRPRLWLRRCRRRAGGLHHVPRRLHRGRRRAGDRGASTSRRSGCMPCCGCR